ncbi:MAG: choice-of-anchor D domain-containing protein, partial [Actinomycetes bacterium]
EYAPIRTWSIGTGTRYSPPGVAGGKIYVGNLEGRLIGFGQPTQTALTAAGTFLGSSTVGAATTGNVTVTAGANPVTINSLSTTARTAFTVQSSGLSFPIHLAAGDSVDVPIQFLPTKPGPVGSTLTANTGSGAVTFAIAADALASGPWLKLSPAAVTFGSTVYRTTGRASLTLANQGNAELLINSVSSLPTGVALQSGIRFPIHVPSGASVALGLTWNPRRVGSLKSSLTVRTNGGEAAGSRTVGLLGFAVKPGELVLSPSASISFGSVRLGSHLSKTLVLTNTGGATVTLTKYKPPVGGAFRQSGALDEGGRIAPGRSVTVNFIFTPTTKTSATASLYVTGDDGSGPRVVKFTGRGV